METEIFFPSYTAWRVVAVGRKTASFAFIAFQTFRERGADDSAISARFQSLSFLYMCTHTLSLIFIIIIIIIIIIYKP